MNWTFVRLICELEWSHFYSLPLIYSDQNLYIKSMKINDIDGEYKFMSMDMLLWGLNEHNNL